MIFLRMNFYSFKKVSYVNDLLTNSIKKSKKLINIYPNRKINWGNKDGKVKSLL